MYILSHRVSQYLTEYKCIKVFLIESQKSKDETMLIMDKDGEVLYQDEEECQFFIEEDAKRKMTYEDLVFYIRNSGMKIREFASMLNMKPNSITNLKKEGIPIPKLLFAVALLSYEIYQFGGDAREVLEPFEFEKIKPKRKSGEKGLFKKKYRV